jgi:hypothetical protein
VGFRPKSGFFRGLENRSMLDSMFSPAMFDSMFHLPLPILEKLARPVIVSLVLVVLLRLSARGNWRSPTRLTWWCCSRSLTPSRTPSSATITPSPAA